MRKWKRCFFFPKIGVYTHNREANGRLLVTVCLAKLKGDAFMDMPYQRIDTAKITIAQIIIAQYVVLAWFFLALGASLGGLFVTTQSSPPLAIGLAVVVPILLFFLVYLTSTTFRRFVYSINPVTITAIQFYRVLGVAMLILNGRNILPAVFALPAGWGDVAIGIAAPLAALALASGTRSGKTVFLIWNVLGMLDLILAVSLGILASRISSGLPVNTAVMAVFPMSLIPTFLVPLSFILHLIGLNQLRAHPQL